MGGNNNKRISIASKKSTSRNSITDVKTGIKLEVKKSYYITTPQGTHRVNIISIHTQPYKEKGEVKLRHVIKYGAPDTEGTDALLSNFIKYNPKVTP